MMAAALCPVPLVSVPVPPTRCGKRRTPPPANKSPNRLIDPTYAPREHAGDVEARVNEAIFR